MRSLEKRWETAVLVASVIVLFWLSAHAAQIVNGGFHAGYDRATDRECMSFVIQWCR